MRTLVPMVLAPVFVLVLMTFVLLIMTGRARLQDLASGKVKMADVALAQNGWTVKTAQVSNAFNNQFQMPLLFYTLVILVLMTAKQDYLFVVCEWIFVATRIVHAFIYVTSNNVPRRFQAYAAGVLLLFLMWIWYAIRILAAI